MKICTKNQVMVDLSAMPSSPLFGNKERTIDDFTKKILYTADKLFLSDFSEMEAMGSAGAVLSVEIAPFHALTESAHIIYTHGPKRLNPSFFPNIMVSTALSHLTQLLGIHGPCCTFYEKQACGQEARRYAELQIFSGQCTSMITIHIKNNEWAVGRYLVQQCNTTAL